MKNHTETFVLRTKDCDINSEWRFSSILEAMQETAGAHCDLMGCGRNDLKKKGIAWVLVRSKVQMKRLPVIGEIVSVETFHTPLRHRLFPRYFLLRNQQEQVIGKAGTLWVLMDLETRKTMEPDEIAAMMPDNSDMLPPLRLPSSIQMIETADVTDILYQPTYSDLDANGHMNNAKYADLICNLLGTDCLMKNQIHTMMLIYNAEILPHQQTQLCFQRAASQCRLVGLLEKSAAFEIACELSPRQQELVGGSITHVSA